jgi:signal transduction histidine kinase
VVDPAGLQQILGHLIENAVKYSPAGGTLRLRVAGQGGSVVIDVVDEGVGLPHGVDVFAAFQRGPDHETSGVGLGLYIVRNLVEGMGGKVTARSNAAGPGSTFTVVLPGPA